MSFSAESSNSSSAEGSASAASVIASAWVADTLPFFIAAFVFGRFSARFPSCSNPDASRTDTPSCAANQSAAVACPFPRHSSVFATRTAENTNTVVNALSATARSSTTPNACSADRTAGSRSWANCNTAIRTFVVAAVMPTTLPNTCSTGTPTTEKSESTPKCPNQHRDVLIRAGTSSAAIEMAESARGAQSEPRPNPTSGIGSRGTLPLPGR
ncbi:MAG: hypothetical protein U0P45_00010 [Acidimicrobiales bacterium]